MQFYIQANNTDEPQTKYFLRPSTAGIGFGRARPYWTEHKHWPRDTIPATVDTDLTCLKSEKAI